MEKLQLAKNKIVATAALGGMALIGLAACDNDPKVDETKPATVIGHEYHAAYTSLVLIGKVLVPFQYPEEFDLEIEQCPANAQAETPKVLCPEETVSVSKDVYHQFPDGSHIVVNPDH